MISLNNLTVLFSIFAITCYAADQECSSSRSCSSCMELGPSCAWCFDETFSDEREGPGFRCASPSILLSRGCSETKIENRRSSLVSGTQSTASPEVQLLPVSQTVKLRPDEPMNVNFTFRSVSQYPVDLYFLVDLSYTMRDDLETVSRMTNQIALTMRNVTDQLQLGFGAFVDKPVFPFVVPTPEYLRNPCLNVGGGQLECDPPFLFKHLLELTNNFAEFKRVTESARPSGNLDSPEGGLDALLQVAHCADFIKWRPNARKIVVFASDGGFHLAGDGRIAGLIRPPPTSCQLELRQDRFNPSVSYVGWHTADQTDYPSVGEVARVLTEKDISVIFAVDKNMSLLYNQLARFLPSAAVGVLSDSAGNIVDLLRDNYAKIANEVKLRAIYDPDLFEVDVSAKCQGDADYQAKQSTCQNHPVGGEIEYRVAVKAKKCFKGQQKITLSVVALDDQSDLVVESACDCPLCGQRDIDASVGRAKCNERGDLKCGVCQCDSGYSGDFCECSAASSAGGDAALLAQCIEPGSDSPCSGRGRCVCGKCKCNHVRFQGDYCQCDRKRCKLSSDDNKVCGGPLRGKCDCDGTCHCEPGYTGLACDCKSSEEQCYDPNNATVPKCSDHGTCDCGQCFCNHGYTGYLCNEKRGGELALCADRQVESCVLCLREALLDAADAYRKSSNDNGIVYDSDEYWHLMASRASPNCSSECNATEINTASVRLVGLAEDGSFTEEVNDVQQQNDDWNLCVIYAKGNCRVIYTHRYSQTIYLERKVDLRIVAKKDCTETINIVYIVVGVIVGIVIGGLIILLIYKLVITIDDRRELAKFVKQSNNIRWEMAENPIFESPITKVENPTFSGNDY